MALTCLRIFRADISSQTTSNLKYVKKVTGKEDVWKITGNALSRCNVEFSKTSLPIFKVKLFVDGMAQAKNAKTCTIWG